MLCNCRMADTLPRPRRISLSSQRANSYPMLFLNAIKKSRTSALFLKIRLLILPESAEELAVFLANPEFNINVAQDGITGIKLALEIGWSSIFLFH